MAAPLPLSLAPNEAASPASAGLERCAIPARLLANLAACPPETLVATALRTFRQQHGGMGWFHVRFESPGLPGACAGPVIEDRSTAEDDGRKLLGDMVQSMEQAAIQAALLAAKTGALASVGFPLFRQPATAWAYPVMDRGLVLSAICQTSLPSQSLQMPAGLLLPMAAQLAMLQTTRREAARERSLFRRAAALTELFAAASAGSDFPECARDLANHLRDSFGCDLVALAVQRRGRTRLAAVSGWNPHAESQSGGRAVLEAGIAGAISRGQTRVIGPETGALQDDDATVQSLREWFTPSLGIIAPLLEPNGSRRGGWVFLWKTPPSDAARLEALIGAAGPEVASFLPLLRAAKPGPVRGSLIRLWRRATRNQQRFATAVAWGIAAILAIPAPFPVETGCELAPVVRRVVAAPFDGILERSRVQAGETVEPGQVLAELDGREIRWNLADTVARRAKALAEADLALASGKIAEARMATLEAESLEQEMAVLDYRNQHLTVRAPIGGVVIRGDLERSEGAPLRLGDPLFEIGPLDRLLMELSASSTDAPLLREGATVSLSLESFPGQTFHGRVSRIAPRSESRDGRNIVLCEAELANPDGLLRPGLKGKGRIQGPRRPLIWRWLRAPWMAVRQATW